jgi:transposase
MDIGIGIDAHKDELAVAAVDRMGRVLAQGVFGNECGGHTALVQWVVRQGAARCVGIEGAGNYAWQLTQALRTAGEDVREVPGRLTRRERRHQRRPGKSDPTDAVAIARVVVRGEPLPPAATPGPARDLKVLVGYRDALGAERTRVANQLHADLRAMCPGYGRTIAHLSGRRALELARRLLADCPGVQADVARWRLTRLRALDRELVQLQRRLGQLLTGLGRALPAVRGVGPIVAARVRGEVGDVRRFVSEPAFAMACGIAPIPASSGQTSRHRLNRGGNRRLNSAVHTVALVQARVDPRAKAYLARKRAEGKSWREALRCLKRQLAKIIYRALILDAAETTVLTT